MSEYFFAAYFLEHVYNSGLSSVLCQKPWYHKEST